MPEFEELRLKVIVDNQASAQLAQLRTQLGQFGGGDSQQQQQQQGFERVRTNMGALNPIMRTVASGSLSARNAMAIMTGVMGSAGVAVAGLGFAFVNQAQRLKAFTQNIIDIDTKAKALGVEGGALDNVLKQMRRMGVENNRAIPFIEGVVKGIAGLSTQGSAINQFIDTKIKAGHNRERIDAFILSMTGFAAKGDLEGMLEEFIASANYVYDTELAETKDEVLARETWKTYLRAFGVDPETTLMVPGTYKRQTDEEKAAHESSLKAAEAYNLQYNALSQRFAGFNKAMQNAMLPAFTEINKLFAEGEIDAQRWGQIFGTTIANELRDIMGIIKAIQAVMNFADNVDQRVEVVVKRGEEFQQMSGADLATRARARRQQTAAPPIEPVAIEPVSEQGEVPTPPAPEAAAKEGGGGGILSRIGSWLGRKQGGGAVAGGQPYMVGEGGPELFVPQGGGTILPGFGGAGGGAGSGMLREQIEEMRDNTEMVNQTTTLMRDLAEEFKQLNDFLQPKGETGGQPEARRYGGSAYKGRRYRVGEAGPEAFRQRGGGVRKNRPVVVGEKGPEIFVPPTSGDILTGRQALQQEDIQGGLERTWKGGAILPEYAKAERVDPRLFDILDITTSRMPEGWRAKAFSGYRAPDPGKKITSFHGMGLGADIALYDPEGAEKYGSKLVTGIHPEELGKSVPTPKGSVPWLQSAEAFKTYEAFAQEARKVQQEFYPELSDKFTWGGYFKAGKAFMDLMHFSIGGEQAEGGTWEEGLKPEVAKRWGIEKALPSQLAFDHPPPGELETAAAAADMGAAAASAELDRGEMDNMMGGEVSTVKGKGNIDVKVGGNGGGRRNGNGKHLLKDVRIERPTQMQPAEAGPSGTDTTAETA